MNPDPELFENRRAQTGAWHYAHSNEKWLSFRERECQSTDVREGPDQSESNVATLNGGLLTFLVWVIRKVCRSGVIRKRRSSTAVTAQVATVRQSTSVPASSNRQQTATTATRMQATRRPEGNLRNDARLRKPLFISPFVNSAP